MTNYNRASSASNADTYRLEEVLDLCMEMTKESPYPFETSRDHFRSLLVSGMFEVFVEDVDGRHVGFLIGTASEDHIIFGKIKSAAELAWYVHTDFRGEGIAVKLLNKFENWARVNDCKFIVNAAIHNSSFDKVKYMYEKAGYTQVEVAFIKELN